MPKLSHRAPKYRLHKASGQAVVRVDGKDVYLGPFGSAESKAAYKRLLAERLAGAAQRLDADRITVTELCVAYFKHAKQYYASGNAYRKGHAVCPLKPFGA